MIAHVAGVIFPGKMQPRDESKMFPTSNKGVSAMPFLSPPWAAVTFLLVCALGVSPAQAEPVKVAFIGDQGIYIEAQQVLELIRDEGAELLLVQGDLGYDPNTAGAWINNMDNILGRDFPVLMVVGNHENFEWPAYLQWQKDKLARQDSIRCEGDISVKAYCTYKNIGVVQVAPGITEVEGINGNDNYAEYITQKFESDNSTWRICSWHKNMRDMQTGSKSDATGWAVYQSCLAQGGLVMTGHEHAYSRTHLMSSFEAKTVIHRNNEMEIGPRSSLAFVSGLGGRGIRPQLHDGDWFASVYTADQNANYGALFCTFDNNQADCYMKDVAGLVPDAFSLTSSHERVASAEQTETESDVVAEAAPEAQSEEQSDISPTELNEPSEQSENTEQVSTEPSGEPVNTEQASTEPSGEPMNTEQESSEPSGESTNTEQESSEPSEESVSTEQESAQTTETSENITQQGQVDAQQASTVLGDSLNQNLADSIPTSSVDNGQTVLISGDVSASLAVVAGANDDQSTDSNNSSASSGGGLVHWLTLLSLLSLTALRRLKPTSH